LETNEEFRIMGFMVTRPPELMGTDLMAQINTDKGYGGGGDDVQAML
jgi:hypothetical protein